MSDRTKDAGSAENLPTTIKLGRYRHYKGKDYEVLGTATHSETLELLVLYRPLYGDGGYWVRPQQMFQENIQMDGVEQPRFSYIGEMNE